MEQSILTPVFREAGAELTRTEPAVLLAHGEVPAEYRAGLDHAALFDQTDRGLVEVSGEEAAVFLHRLLANDVRTLRPGGGNRNLLLTSKGKVRFEFDVTVEPERFLLSTEPGRAAALIEALDTYLFAEEVTFADRTDEHAPIALCGPDAPAIAARVAGCDPPSYSSAPYAWIDGSLATDSGTARVDEEFWVAVLPFKFKGADLAALADGLSEEIVTGLFHFSYLKVIARSSTERYSGEIVDVRAVGREIGARYVLDALTSGVHAARTGLRIALPIAPRRLSDESGHRAFQRKRRVGSDRGQRRSRLGSTRGALVLRCHRTPH